MLHGNIYNNGVPNVTSVFPFGLGSRILDWRVCVPCLVTFSTDLRQCWECFLIDLMPVCCWRLHAMSSMVVSLIGSFELVSFLVPCGPSVVPPHLRYHVPSLDWNCIFVSSVFGGLSQCAFGMFCSTVISILLVTWVISHMNAVSPYSVLSVHMHKRDSGIQARWFSSQAQPVMHPGELLTESSLMALRQ